MSLHLPSICRDPFLDPFLAEPAESYLDSHPTCEMVDRIHKFRCLSSLVTNFNCNSTDIFKTVKVMGVIEGDLGQPG
jgi:hypothetical protein